MEDIPSLGQIATVEVKLTDELVAEFVRFSGDNNPIHLDDRFAAKRGFEARIVHGMVCSSFISTLIGKYLPGPGAVWTSQTLRFTVPVYVGDTLSIRGEIVTVDRRGRTVFLRVVGSKQTRETVLEGTCEVRLPTTRQHRAAPLPIPAMKVRLNPSNDSRTAVVVGAGGDLGKEITTRLLRDGYRVALAGRDYPTLCSLAETLSAKAGPPDVFAVALDLSDRDSVSHGINTVETEFGNISIVVHAATAPLNSAPLEDLPTHHIIEHVSTQAIGLLNLFQACASGMIERQNGVLIFIGSTVISGKIPKGLAGYAAGKSAASAIVKGIAMEYGPKGIRANIVSPSFLDTNLNSRVTERMKALVAARIPMKRIGKLSEIADAVSFLANDRAKFINGHELIIDGGEILT